MTDTEEVTRHLLKVAAEHAPPGIDLLRGIQARRRKRAVRLRAAMAASAVGIAAAVTAVSLSAIKAPSALAQVKTAAARTAAGGYRVHAAERIVKMGGLRSQPWTTASGAFDPVKGIGEQRDNLGAQIRYTGGYMYVFVTHSLREGARAQGTPIPGWASWERLPIRLQPGADVNKAELAMLGGFPALLGQADPQDLLALLRSATQVRQAGPASGPGWIGSAYRFTTKTTLTGPLHTPVSTSGTVDIDQHGLVRQLDAQDSFAGTVRKVKIAFTGFGRPVSVSPPPASVTFIPPDR
jgi:hypothetical protein